MSTTFPFADIVEAEFSAHRAQHRKRYHLEEGKAADEFEWEFDGSSATSAPIDPRTGKGKTSIRAEVTHMAAQHSASGSHTGFDAGKPAKVKGTLEFAVSMKDLSEILADAGITAAEAKLKTANFVTSGIPTSSDDKTVQVNGEVEIVGHAKLPSGMATPAVPFTGTFSR